jgi:abortive infection bacteriophage resistance protein
MTDKILYNKSPFTSDELIVQIESRGLIVEDAKRAKRYLEFIGYYRLSAYFPPYQNGKDKFKEGVKFNDILSLYIFDRKLKLILMDAIERIEVAIRSAITNYMSLSTNDPHWFLTDTHFNNYSPQKEKSFQNYQGFLNSIHNSLKKQNRAIPIVHYHSKYSSPDYPPAWVIMEFLTLGQVSKVYSILQIKYKKRIAKKFKISWQLLEAVLLSLTVIRNKCAHHQRVWNVNLSYPPPGTVLKKIAPNYKGSPNSPCVGYFMIFFLINKMSNNSKWGSRLCEQLFELDESLFPNIGLGVNEIYTYLMDQ